MPRLVNAGHEAFAQAYIANGSNGAEAYRTAYPKCKTNRAAEVNGSRLLRNTEVLARVAKPATGGQSRSLDVAVDCSSLLSVTRRNEREVG